MTMAEYMARAGSERVNNRHLGDILKRYMIINSNKAILQRIIDTWPTHYTENDEHFIRRFNNLADDIAERIVQYRARPDCIDIDPRYPHENELFDDLPIME